MRVKNLPVFELDRVLVRLDHDAGLAALELDNFLFEVGLSFAFRDERLDSFEDDIGDPHMFSLRYLAKPLHRFLVKAIERPAAFKNKGRNIARSRFWRGCHAARLPLLSARAQETIV
jgi:hypothetical protein